MSNIYLDEADRAADQSSMELAQKLAAQSIVRLAGLRQLASSRISDPRARMVDLIAGAASDD